MRHEPVLVAWRPAPGRPVEIVIANRSMMYSTVPLESVATHRDVSEIRVGSLEEISAPPNVGVSKFSAPVATGEALRVMVVNKASEVLVVALHGATNRAKKELPRFEWFRTLRGEAVSSMYVSDPLLEADPTLELAWYVGRFSYDLHASLAGLIERTAKSVGARRVVILGSSGGGVRRPADRNFHKG